MELVNGQLDIGDQRLINWKKKVKTKINIHKGPPISEATLNTDLKLLEFYEINRKLKNPI